MFIAWISTRHESQGASFATGNTVDDCKADAERKLPEILRRLRMRQAPTATIRITSGPGQRLDSQWCVR